VKDVKARSKEALTKIKTKLTAKVNEVKAIEKTLTGSRIEKQLNKKIRSEPTITLPSRFTAMFNTMFSSTYLPFLFLRISFLFTIQSYPIFRIISFKHLLSENSVTARRFILSRQTASDQAETLVNTLANSDSRLLFKLPETRPDTETYLGTLLFQSTCPQVELGNLKLIFTMTPSNSNT
jgi:hypothetical protein